MGSKTTITRCGLFCLITFAWAPPNSKEGNTRKIQNENMSSPEIEPVTLGFSAGHLARLAIGTVVKLRLKLF